MRAFALAVIAAVVLGLTAAFVLGDNHTLAYQAFATSGTRVSHPGTNLVGPKWNGETPPEPSAKRHGA